MFHQGRVKKQDPSSLGGEGWSEGVYKIKGEGAPACKSNYFKKKFIILGNLLFMPLIAG